MFIGYARVSSGDQSLALQLDALKAANCQRIFTDKQSGAVQDRDGLNQALAFVRTGDTLCVWRLDRLGRSLPHLIKVIGELKDRQIGFKSLTENIDTSTASGQLMLHVLAALTEFERGVLRERTLAGLAAARARGRLGGRPSKMDTATVEMARGLLANSKNSIGDICRTLKISRSTLFRHVSGKTAHV